MIVVIIHRSADTRGSRGKASGKTGKSSTARVLWRRDRPKPPSQLELFRRRVMKGQQPITGLEHIDEGTLNIEVTIDICLAEAERADIAKYTAHHVGRAKNPFDLYRGIRLGRPLLASRSCTANSRGPKRAKTVCRSERAENSTGFVIADAVVMTHASPQPNTRSPWKSGKLRASNNLSANRLAF
jgi:hypothetical protein